MPFGLGEGQTENVRKKGKINKKQHCFNLLEVEFRIFFFLVFSMTHIRMFSHYF